MSAESRLPKEEVWGGVGVVFSLAPHSTWHRTGQGHLGTERWYLLMTLSQTERSLRQMPETGNGKFLSTEVFFL